MKIVIGLLSLALSFVAIASSGETKTFVYDGTRPSVELMLRGEKTHTEYRTETRPSTCYRQEIVGYRTVCTGGGYPRPYPGPRPGPHSCWREPVYRTIAYSCPITVQIPYEVKDYDVEARLIIDVTNLSNLATPGETFTVTLTGDELSIIATGSKKFLIVQKRRDLRTSMSGSVKFLDGILAVDLVAAAPVLSALKLSALSYNRDTLSLKTGLMDNRASFGFGLKAVKHRRVATDLVVFDRDLAPGEISARAAGEQAELAINVADLGINMADTKMTFTAKMFYTAAGPILNRSQFDLEATKSLTVDNRN